MLKLRRDESHGKSSAIPQSPALPAAAAPSVFPSNAVTQLLRPPADPQPPDIPLTLCIRFNIPWHLVLSWCSVITSSTSSDTSLLPLVTSASYIEVSGFTGIQIRNQQKLLQRVEDIKIFIFFTEKQGYLYSYVFCMNKLYKLIVKVNNFKEL